MHLNRHRLYRLNQSGFTLIEVMVALSLLALGIAGAASLASRSLHQTATLKHAQSVAFLAHGHLESLAVRPSVGASVQRGQYNQYYQWELSLQPVELDEYTEPEKGTVRLAALSEDLNPVRADLTVWYDEGRRNARFHTLLLLAKDTGSD